jgi:AraC family transcriptional regulator of arabinose operon
MTPASFAAKVLYRMVDYLERKTTLYETTLYRCLEYHQKQTEDLYLTLCGMEQCPAGSIVQTEDQKAGYHLHIILSGKGFLTVRGVKQNLQFGQMFITKPGEISIYGADEEEPWSYCWMSFDGNNAKGYAESAGFKEGIYSQNCYVDQQKFSELVRRILEQPELTLANDLMRLGTLLEYISLAIESNYKLTQVVRHPHEYAPDVYVKHAIDFIVNNYTTIKVNDIAKYIGINRSYLTNIFKKKMNVSPQEYLLQYRLQQGCKLLLETHLSIQEVSRKIGYENPLTFSKMFKSVYGVSPSQYRAQGGGCPLKSDEQTADSEETFTEKEQNT